MVLVLNNMPSVSLKSVDENCHNVMLYISDVLKPQDSDYFGYKHISEIEYKEKSINIHLTLPKNGTYLINYPENQTTKNLKIVISDLVVDNKTIVINTERKPFQIVKVVEIFDDQSDDNSEILEFIEKCHIVKKNKIDNILNTKDNKICIKHFNGYCWDVMSLVPKRKKETLFLKEGQMENIRHIIDDFISKDTYQEYVENGIPYKCNILLHGNPGVGKTSLVHYIASEYNIDVSTLSVNSELKESEFIQAFRTIDKNSNSGLSMLVIEDIDCLFSNRKENDVLRNNLTLQGILNTLDGFGSKEGLIVIITTNKPEVLDNALVRSRRIDHKIELSYLNRYQALNMFQHFFKEKTEFFETLWEHVKTHQVQPASFHQFLFENRKETDFKKIKIQEFVKSLKSENQESMYT